MIVQYMTGCRFFAAQLGIYACHFGGAAAGIPVASHFYGKILLVSSLYTKIRDLQIYSVLGREVPTMCSS
jgi:hypothetical protein